jgi:hypothetical protein
VVEHWTIKPHGEGLKRLDTAPPWYVDSKTSPYFTNVEPESESSPTPGASPESSESPMNRRQPRQPTNRPTARLRSCCARIQTMRPIRSICPDTAHIIYCAT